MFDLVDRPTVWIPVKWPGLIPGPDDGLAVATEHVIEIEVLLVDKDELSTVFPGGPVENELEVFRHLVKGWRKFKVGGVSAPFDDEHIKRLLAVPMFAHGFENAYLKAWQGKAEAREKNSVSSPGNGRAADHDPATISTPNSGGIASATA